ncbi:MAG: hypothetical protein ACRDRO_24575 [Pseudonocardiaceae bacterium]
MWYNDAQLVQRSGDVSVGDMTQVPPVASPPLDERPDVSEADVEAGLGSGRVRVGEASGQMVN